VDIRGVQFGSNEIGRIVNRDIILQLIRTIQPLHERILRAFPVFNAARYPKLSIGYSQRIGYMKAPIGEPRVAGIQDCSH
jgi:hypothetical protein